MMEHGASYLTQSNQRWGKATNYRRSTTRDLIIDVYALHQVQKAAEANSGSSG